MSFPFAIPWVGTKKVAFVPVFRDGPDVVPPDVIPNNWRDIIMDRVVGGPPENWRDVTLRRVVDDGRPRDRSLRAWLKRVSWDKANINPVVWEIRTVSQAHVEPGHFANEPIENPNDPNWRSLNEDHLKAQGFTSGVLVMLGGGGAGTTSGFWSRIVMDETNGTWLHEILHAITNFKDLYHFNNDLDPEDRGIKLFDIMSSSQQTHPTAFTKRAVGWLRDRAIGQYTIGSGFRSIRLLPISSFRRPRFLPIGPVHGIRIGDRVPYFMVEARQKTDYFESGGSTGQGGIRSEGVIAYRVWMRDPMKQERPCCRKPIYLETLPALQSGQSILLDNVKVHVASQVPEGYIIHITTEPITVPGIGQVSVPNVVEKDWEEAERLLVQTGICSRINGPQKDNMGNNTKIQSQSIPAGAITLWGAEMTLERA
jgi:hypothetical protein